MLIQPLLWLNIVPQAYASAYYGEGFGPILLDYVNCTGTEATLLDCSHTNHSQCDHSSDAGVDCIGELMIRINCSISYMCINIYKHS